MNWSAGVGGSGLALATALGSGCPSGIETDDEIMAIPAHRVL